MRALPPEPLSAAGRCPVASALVLSTVLRPAIAVLFIAGVTSCSSDTAREVPDEPTRTAASKAPSARPTTPATTPSASPRGALSGLRIGIDPGHNGRNASNPAIITRQIWNGRNHQDCNTTGTSTDGGYPESRFTFAVANHLAGLVEEAGGTVVLTRDSDNGVGPCVDQRARILNDAHVDVAIDIHADGGPATGRGFAVLLPVRSGVNDAVVSSSTTYGHILRDAFSATGMPISTYLGDQGFESRGDLAGLNLTTVPQVLIECGNMRNARDAELLTSDAFQQRAASTILAAMKEFLARRPREPRR